MQILTRTLLIITISLFTVTQIHAKGKKIKFGRVSMEELKMTEYEYDTSAVAVVLYERGYYDGNTHSFYKHIRYKILKTEGLDYANSAYNTETKGSIKGITFNLENGEIVETKLDKENVFTEKVWDRYFIYILYY